MGPNTRLSIAAWDLALEGILNALDGGSVDIYAGEQPASGDDSPGGGPLATLKLGTPAFQGSEGGTKVAHPIAGAPARANGLATWFRARTRAGVGIIDGSAGTMDPEGNHPDMVLNSAQISEGALVSWSTWSVTAAG